MLINTLEEAEQIVSSSKNLQWIGWDIVSWTPNNAGFSNKNGLFLNNQWGIQKKYPLTSKGWYLPVQIKGALK